MELPDDVLDEYRSLFSYFDRDGGGTIGPDEIKQVMEAFNWAPEDKLIKVRMILLQTFALYLTNNYDNYVPIYGFVCCIFRK